MQAVGRAGGPRGCEECDPLPVRRKERIESSFGPRQRLRVDAIQPSQHQPPRPATALDVDQRRPVRSHGERRFRRHGGRQRERKVSARAGRGRCNRAEDRGQDDTDRHQTCRPDHARPPSANRRSGDREPGGVALGRGVAGGLEVADRLSRIAHPPSEVPLETSTQHPPDRGRRGRRKRRQIRFMPEDPRQHVRRCLAAEQALAGEHLVEHHPERPKIGARVNRDARVARRLLRGHVGRRPQNHAHPRGGRGDRGRLPCTRIHGRGRIERLRQPEVEHLDGAVLPHNDVGRLEIPMDDARFVRRPQGDGDLPGDRQRVVERQRALCDALGEGGAFDQLEHQRPDAIGLRGAVDLRDVRMVQGGKDPCLPLEARPTVRVGGERVGQHLQSYVAVERRIAGAIHFAHATGPERAGDRMDANPGADRQQHPILGPVSVAYPATAGSRNDGANARQPSRPPESRQLRSDLLPPRDTRVRFPASPAPPTAPSPGPARRRVAPPARGRATPPAAGASPRKAVLRIARRVAASVPAGRRGR